MTQWPQSKMHCLNLEGVLVEKLALAVGMLEVEGQQQGLCQDRWRLPLAYIYRSA